METTRITTVGWTYTSKCNLNCRHCYNKSTNNPYQKEIGLQKAVEVLSKLKEYGIKEINYGGGENTMVEEFWQISITAKEMGFKQSLTTNGVLMDENMADMCQERFSYGDVGVSIDFPSAKDNNAFRLGKDENVFKRSIRAVELLVKRGLEVEIVMCLSRLNCQPEIIQRMIELCKSLGVGNLRMNTFRPVGRGEFDRQLTMDAQDLKRSYSFLFESMGNSGYDTTTPDPLSSLLGGKFSSTQGCPCGKTSMRIQSNGEVSPCVFVSLSGGNILKQSVDEIYNSLLFRKFQHQERSGKCTLCPRWDVCKGGCVGRKWAIKRTFDGPDPLCWWEPGEDIEGYPQMVSSQSYNIHERYLCTFYYPINGHKQDDNP